MNLSWNFICLNNYWLRSLYQMSQFSKHCSAKSACTSVPERLPNTYELAFSLCTSQSDCALRSKEEENIRYSLNKWTKWVLDKNQWRGGFGFIDSVLGKMMVIVTQVTNGDKWHSWSKQSPHKASLVPSGRQCWSTASRHITGKGAHGALYMSVSQSLTPLITTHTQTNKHWRVNQNKRDLLCV